MFPTTFPIHTGSQISAAPSKVEEATDRSVLKKIISMYYSAAI